MLVNTKDVAERLKISNRAVQNKCAKAGLVKIGNQYQITKDIAEQWYAEAEKKERTEPEAKERNLKTSQRSGAKSSPITSLLIIFLSIALVVVLTFFYVNLDTQIVNLKTEAAQTKTEHKAEVKQFTKRLNDAQDVIQTQTNEIRILKFNDSIRTFKRW